MAKSKKMYYGWWIVIAIMMTSLVGSANPFSVVLKQLIEQFHTGRGMISLLMSISMGAGGLAGIFVGRLLLNHKPRRFMLWGALVNGLVMLLISMTNSLWQLYVCYFILGVATMGFSMIATFTLVSKWFSKNWGTAMGLYMAGGAVGSIIVTPIVGLIAENFGWRTNYLIAGSLVLLINVPLILFMMKDSPEQVGQYLDGNKMPELPKAKERRTLMAGRNDNAPKSGLSRYLKQPSLWILAISFAFITLGDSAVMQHQVSFITDMNISTAIAASALGVTMGISGFAKFSAGWLADRISTRYVSIVFLFFEILGIFILMHANNISDVWLFVVVYGLGSGTGGILLPLVIRDVFGPADFSAVFGFVNVIYTAGAVFGISMAGFIFDITGSYSRAFIIITITYLVATIGIYAAFGAKPKPLLKSVKG